MNRAVLSDTELGASTAIEFNVLSRLSYGQHVGALSHYVDVNVGGERPRCQWTTDALHTGEGCVHVGTKQGCGTAPGEHDEDEGDTG